MATQTYGGRTYSNGNVPPSVLAELEPRGRHGNSGTARAYLRSDAAEAWNRAAAEVKEKTGLDLRVRGWNRSRAEQDRFWYERMTTTPLPGRPTVRWNGRTWYRRPGYASVAPPGTSNHGWALAVDIIDFGGVGQWNHPRYLKAWPILAKHGWTESEGRQPWVNEPWHKVYSPSADLVSKGGASTGGSVTTPTLPGAPAPIQEDDMPEPKDLWSHELHVPPKLQEQMGKKAPAGEFLIRSANQASANAANVAALTAAVATLAKSQGLDPKAVQAAIDKAVKAALSNLEITLKTEG